MKKAKIIWSGEYDSIGQKIPELKKCKNCDGSGKVEFDSYDIFNLTSKPKTSIEKCKRCKGTGNEKI